MSAPLRGGRIRAQVWAASKKPWLATSIGSTPENDSIPSRSSPSIRSAGRRSSKSFAPSSILARGPRGRRRSRTSAPSATTPSVAGSGAEALALATEEPPSTLGQALRQVGPGLILAAAIVEHAVYLRMNGPWLTTEGDAVAQIVEGDFLIAGIDDVARIGGRPLRAWDSTVDETRRQPKKIVDGAKYIPIARRQVIIDGDDVNRKPGKCGDRGRQAGRGRGGLSRGPEALSRERMVPLRSREDSRGATKVERGARSTASIRHGVEARRHPADIVADHGWCRIECVQRGVVSKAR